MTRSLPPIPDAELSRTASPSIGDDERGFGALRTKQGHLPVEAMDVRGRIDGLLARVVVRQTFVNAFDEPLEAAYIFPLPDRAAVTQFRMTVGGREIEGILEERGQAREHYEEAIAQGERAAIAEEDRPGVFNLRVGNLMPGERATVELTLCGVLPYADGEVTFRFPLVVAPRYIPGRPLPGPSSGDGVILDTHAVPDASRITPPVLLPGFPNPVRLSLEVELFDGAASLGEVCSSLHAVQEDVRDGYRRIRVQPGERLDRDFILRFRLGGAGIQSTLTLHPESGDPQQGTFALTIIPPAESVEAKARPRDVVFVLDRSGSMEGWKIVAARRALARMIDTLGEADRFSVLAFDTTIEGPKSLLEGLTAAADRARFRAVEYLATLEARGGTEMAEPLDRAVKLLTSSPGGDRDRILVLITDGQVGNEDQILKMLGTRLRSIRVFTIGIDRAVNEGFLRRLSERGGGSCELVESEDRLDEVLSKLHRRIGTPLLTGLSLEPEGLSVEPGEVVPRRFPDLFAGSPLLILGRYRGRPGGSIGVRGTDAGGTARLETVPATVRENPAIAAAWARGQIRQLEDRYAARDIDLASLEKSIVALSLRFQILCRFTAYVAVDRARVVNLGGSVHRITQPVEMPSGWAVAAPPSPARSRMMMRTELRELFGAGGLEEAAPQGAGGGSGGRVRGGAPPRRAGGGSGGGARGGAPPCGVPPLSSRGAGGSFGGRSPQEPPGHMARMLPPAPVGDRTLEDDLIAARKMDTRDAADLVARIAEAVQRLHDSGFVHAELSPSRVVMSGQNLPGVSPPLGGWQLLERQSWGTAHLISPYSAPERLGSPACRPLPLVDLYSLGVILYELLTGKKPFAASDPADLARSILRDVPAPPRQIEATIPAELEAICLKAMAKDPAARYRTASEFAAALRKFLKAGRGAFWKSS
jgi:Ca-activated chloride channel family protein